jgi:hypothetical protein
VIELPRSLARRFRAVLRRSLQDLEQRNLWPLLLCRIDPHGVCLEAQCPDFAIRYLRGPPGPADPLVFRSSVLADIEAAQMRLPGWSASMPSPGEPPSSKPASCAAWTSTS